MQPEHPPGEHPVPDLLDHRRRCQVGVRHGRSDTARCPGSGALTDGPGPTVEVRADHSTQLANGWSRPSAIVGCAPALARPSPPPALAGSIASVLPPLPSATTSRSKCSAVMPPLLSLLGSIVGDVPIPGRAGSGLSCARLIK